MKHYIGVWLDRRRAVLATCHVPGLPYEMEDPVVRIEHIRSEVEGRTRLAGGSRTGSTPWGPQEVAVDRKIEARQNQQLKIYYGQVIERLKEAEKILIMGPGEAKLGLRKHIEKSSKTMAKRIMGVETCDKMTERQLAAKVRSVFIKSRSE